MRPATAIRALPARGVAVGILACFFIALAAVSPAMAAETHKFEGHITLASGTNPQPSGVDPEGNIIVWLDGQEVIAKFDPQGNPVNFSALGTNVIDGFGGLECPQVPTDCDRVPAGKIGPVAQISERKTMVVVDQSNGPAKGYIYLKNQNIQSKTGEINVFAPTGKYLGSINEAQAQPWNAVGTPAGNISIAPNGALYVSRGFGGCCPGATSGGEVDQYVPISADPTKTLFVGQLRFAAQYPVPEVNFPANYVIGMGQQGAVTSALGSAADLSRPLGNWRWYSQAEFQKPLTQGLYSLAKDYKPFPRHNNRQKCNGNCTYRYGSINPATNRLNLWGSAVPGIVIYESDLHTPAGPEVAKEASEMASGQLAVGRDIAYDNSGGPHHGKFYVKSGENTLSVFSAPVTIPDIAVGGSSVGHTTATVTAEIGTAGGGEITDCQVDYGLTDEYGSTVPCDPAPPYLEDQDVSVDLEGLVTESDYFYRFRASNANGENLTFESQVHPVAVLGVETGPVSGLSTNSATLTGALDADGMDTTYKFEYGISTVYDLETPVGSAGNGSGATPVAPIEVESLQPGRTYHYRLVAENELGTTFGEDRTFTVPAKPLIVGLHPRNVLETSADLHARINNYDSETDYFFEYGPSASVANKTAAAQLGGDPGFQEVGTSISNLEPGLTYFFRVVATNEHGTSVSPIATFDFSPPNCPNSHVRQQTGSNYLPDCRAYELVSPPRAGSIQLFPGDLLSRLPSGSDFSHPDTKHRYQNAGLASSPARFGFFAAFGGLGGLEAPNVILDHYVATRTATGWTTSYPGLKSHESGLTWRGQCSVTFDRCLDYKVDTRPNAIGSRAPFPYLWNVDGSFITRLPTNYAVVPGADHLTGDEVPSGDFSHFVFSSRDLPFAPGGMTEAPGSAYDNHIDAGTVDIVSKLANGDHIPQDAGDASEFIRVQAVTRDGSHILLSSAASGGKTNLFMRVNNAITYDVSGGFGVELIGMSTDGSKVAFMSDFSLTAEDSDSSRDIYLWDESTDTVTLLSTGNGNGNSDACNANWTSGCNVVPIESERPDIDDRIAAGGDVYFYSPEQLDGKNPGVANQRNLYHVNDGAVQYVTTFDPGTKADRMQISADGSFAAFVSQAMLTGYNSAYFDTFGAERVARQMYVFSASTGEVQCASCNPSGEPPAILRQDPPGNETGAMSADVMASKNGRFMSDDGRAAFATADRLVPRDTNDIIDVYEYVEGRPQLITAGTGERDLFPKLSALIEGVHTGLEAVSRDGMDIYFSTFDTLVPQDQNGAFIKFYVARTGGGFPVEGELLPCEAADECVGETSSPPSHPQVGTGTPYTVAGNVSAGAKRKAKRRQQQLRKRKQQRLRKRRQRQRQLRKKRAKRVAGEHARRVRRGSR